MKDWFDTRKIIFFNHILWEKNDELLAGFEHDNLRFETGNVKIEFCQIKTFFGFRESKV